MYEQNIQNEYVSTLPIRPSASQRFVHCKTNSLLLDDNPRPGVPPDLNRHGGGDGDDGGEGAK